MLYTTFETTKTPSVWSDIINRYDRLLVSCPTIAKVLDACEYVCVCVCVCVCVRVCVLLHPSLELGGQS